jgi:hypothetical protein
MCLRRANQGRGGLRPGYRRDVRRRGTGGASMALAGSLSSLGGRWSERRRSGRHVDLARGRAGGARSRPEIIEPEKSSRRCERESSGRRRTTAVRAESFALASAVSRASKIHFFRDATGGQDEGLTIWRRRSGRGGCRRHGTMGSGITQALLAAGLKVVVYDVDRRPLFRGEARVARRSRASRAGRLSGSVRGVARAVTVAASGWSWRGPTGDSKRCLRIRS